MESARALLADGALAAVRKGGVHGDAVQPSREGRFAAEGRQLADHLQQHVLGDVLRVHVAAEHRGGLCWQMPAGVVAVNPFRGQREGGKSSSWGRGFLPGPSRSEHIHCSKTPHDEGLLSSVFGECVKLSAYEPRPGVDSACSTGGLRVRRAVGPGLTSTSARSYEQSLEAAGQSHYPALMKDPKSVPGWPRSSPPGGASSRFRL